MAIQALVLHTSSSPATPEQVNLQKQVMSNNVTVSEINCLQMCSHFVQGDLVICELVGTPCSLKSNLKV